jgi:multidrug efflux pump subunit AcrA (membrane-fusion protein)
VLCKPGDHVNRYQPLARVDTNLLQTEIEKIQFALKKDRANLAGMKGAGLMTPAQIAEGEYAVMSDQLELESKNHELVAAKTLALISGVVSQVNVHDGESVTKGQPLVTVVSVSDPKIECDVAAALYPKLRVGQYVRFILGSYKSVGHLEFISPMADSGSQTMHLRAAIDDPDGKLHPGLVGQMQMWVPE